MLVARRVAESPPSVAPDQKFAVLRRAARVWVVAAIHGDAARLSALHQLLAGRFAPGDRLVYSGNYFGHGAAIVPALDELLLFRREIIAQPRMFASDVVYLRGSQEEMWVKMLQLQFAVNPREVFEWMLAQGVAATIAAYGGDVERGRVAMRDGPMAIGRWTASLRQAMTDRPGHRALISSLRRAAHTDDRQLLFVHAGLDPSRPLGEQSDALWWGHPGWAQTNTAYEGFRRVVRGFDRNAARTRAPGGVESQMFTYTVDGGCGFGGPLIAACVTPDGGLVDRLEA
jgi:serine/threonine protein phosphatase 1